MNCKDVRLLIVLQDLCCQSHKLYSCVRVNRVAELVSPIIINSTVAFVLIVLQHLCCQCHKLYSCICVNRAAGSVSPMS